jgi:hypothetical protein
MECLAVFRSRWNRAPAMREAMGTISKMGPGKTVGAADRSEASIRAVRICSKTADQGEMTRLRDHVGVMLHLRSLYVSKAAILTISAFSVPVENRSPA